MLDLKRIYLGSPSPQEAADDGELTFTDALPERLATVAAGFGERMKCAIDACIDFILSIKPGVPWFPARKK